MKLKNIPYGTVVHTPTEEEARELLAILHENGWKWCGGGKLVYTNYGFNKDNTCYCLKSPKRVTHSPKDYFICEGYTVLALADFKRLYCEEEKSKPKFEVSDKVIDLQSGTIRIIQDKDYKNGQWSYLFNDEVIEWVIESALEPYTEPETMNDTKDETKELDLCELLKGYDNERFYCIMWGDADIVQFYPDGIRIATCKDHDVYLNIDEQGKCDDDGVCILFPSRALYEQYPLDPYTAWMKWQEEQEYEIRIATGQKKNDYFDIVSRVSFRTPADRDKCIEVIDAFLKQIQQSKSVASLCEEIKAIIEKYSK